MRVPTPHYHQNLRNVQHDLLSGGDLVSGDLFLSTVYGKRNVSILSRGNPWDLPPVVQSLHILHLPQGSLLKFIQKGDISNSVFSRNSHRCYQNFALHSSSLLILAALYFSDFISASQRLLSTICSYLHSRFWLRGQLQIMSIQRPKDRHCFFVTRLCFQ